ncbi:MAG: diadenylate cyclase [Puniceicoccales bacterium]|jgi:DNA integrity scanning protein DisA with diadenylate cyclase activity/mannitol/fructose-specific phosphotransferase system IIA component (Ntr-type)|nr:diadenylate cyclase [Puniceicoccales bacterium]
MNFEQYFNHNSIVELAGKTLKEAAKELLESCGFKGNTGEVSDELVAKENEISSCIGGKIAVLNLRTYLSVPYEIFVGRTKEDIKCGPGRDSEAANILILVLISKHERGYLRMVSTLVNLFQKSSVVNRLQAVKSFDDFKSALIDIFKRAKNIKNAKFKTNELFLRNAVEIARESHCTSVMLFGDIPIDSIDIEEIFDDIRLVNVSPNAPEYSPTGYDSHIELQINLTASNWAHGFRGAILFGITKDIIACDEKICCVGCNVEQGILDTMFIVDVQKEFRPIFTSSTKLLQCDIKPQVLERTLAIASELATEGREGKPVGCLFVLGDINKISMFMKPLVLNPFYGYSESERNILDSFMDETIKEFSLIDGAFVIRGDGIIESAGTLIYTPNHNIVMPSGFGSRHAAAASISWAAECVAIAISESTHSVTVFQNGQMLQIL